MMNFSSREKETAFPVYLRLVLLGRPPWLTRKFRDVGMWLIALVYTMSFGLYLLSSAMKIRLEYRLCDVNNIHFITLAHDIFNTLFICFFLSYSYLKRPDQCVQFCEDFEVRGVGGLLQSVSLFAPAAYVLVINVFWQTTVFSEPLDLIEAIAYHAFSILVWNGLWVYVFVRIYAEHDNLRKLSMEAKLSRVEALNNEIGLYLLLLFAKSVFDAISSLTFYSIQKSPLPQLLLLHEAGVILYDLLFCAAISELSSRVSRDIRTDFLRDAPVMTKVSRGDRSLKSGASLASPMMNRSRFIFRGTIAHLKHYLSSDTSFRSSFKVTGSMPWTPSLQTALLPQGLDAFGVFTVNRWVSRYFSQLGSNR